MLILVVDRVPDRFGEAVERRGHDGLVNAGLTEANLPDAVSGVDVLVVRSTRVTTSVVTAADAVRLVVRAGSGTNTIDCDEAPQVGIYDAMPDEGVEELVEYMLDFARSAG